MTPLNAIGSLNMQRKCPCCDSAGISHLYTNNLERLDGLNMSYKIGACNTCEFIFAYHLPSHDTYARYYSELSKYDFQDSDYKETRTDRLRSSTALRLTHRHLSSDSIIVDIGCGIGYLLSCFSKCGFMGVFGVDPGASSPASASQCFGLNSIYTGVLSNAKELVPLSDATLVTLTGVLEHLWDLRGDLLTLKNAMRPGSYLLIEVPALERFDASEDEPYGEFSLEHIQFFSAKSLDNMLGTVGFEKITSEIIGLPIGTADSLFALYQLTGSEATKDLSFTANDDLESSLVIKRYIAGSRIRCSATLDLLPKTDFILYGAGSHTARLLALMSSEQRRCIRLVVDSNPNLIGKTLGQWEVRDPMCLYQHKDVPIVISSYRSQGAICRYVRDLWPDNSIVLLY